MQYVVYKITCNSQDVDHLYVGVTTNFAHRERDHKIRFKNEKYTFKLYSTIRDHGGFDNWTMEIIESFTCELELDARLRERYWFDELRADLNSRRPYTSRGEWYEINKESLFAKQKIYNIKNRSLINENKKRYHMVNQEKMKEARDAKKETLRENGKQYYKNNKDKIKQYKSQKIHCDACNCECSKGNMFTHNKSKKHLNNLQIENSASKNESLNYERILV